MLDLPIIEVELEIKKGLSRVADPAIGMIKKNIITKNFKPNKNGKVHYKKFFKEKNND